MNYDALKHEKFQACQSPKILEELFALGVLSLTTWEGIYNGFILG
jgi:hypothetical protein